MSTNIRGEKPFRLNTQHSDFIKWERGNSIILMHNHNSIIATYFLVYKLRSSSKLIPFKNIFYTNIAYPWMDNIKGIIKHNQTWT